MRGEEGPGPSPEKLKEEEELAQHTKTLFMGTRKKHNSRALWKKRRKAKGLV